MTKTGGINLVNSTLSIENCWSFSNVSPADDADPIIADALSTVSIKDSTFRSTAHNFLGARRYLLENSTIRIGGVIQYYKHREGGVDTNEFAQYYDVSGNKVITLEDDLADFQTAHRIGNSKVYSGSVGTVSATTGTAVFTLRSAIANQRTVLAKITFVGRQLSNDISNQPSCEYWQTLINYTTGVVASSGVTAIYEHQFSSASHYAFADLGSDTCTITLTNPEGVDLQSGFYKVEFVGNDWLLDSVTTT
jgi:hypothetical protein